MENVVPTCFDDREFGEMVKVRGHRGSSLAPWTVALALMMAASFSLVVFMAFRPSPTSYDARGAMLAVRLRSSAASRRVNELSTKNDKSDMPWVEVLSWEPRASIYHNFLSKEECEYLISLGKPHMVKSAVIDSITGESKNSRVRTSSGAFLRRGQDRIIRDIEKRISDFLFIPEEHGEGMQILHYEAGQKYEPHYDYFLDKVSVKNGGQRLATMLMYLSDVEEGGETVFPSANMSTSLIAKQNDLSECGQTGLAVKPKRGDALAFWSMKPDASLDPTSLHGGCPVIKGNKWSATKWMHVNEFRL
ncbi:hypothetical protein KP509_18G034000 [Ceratopteris richardii]|uniref:procollagen-proline 4-dioxygenase n=1 Tax=Ceratopteris richardii TaxID=49495 RepID=A0A8T2SQ77_CERRI|nr:hypothetical protein KP509_18G034000 [Ceratopteris richardii]